LGSLDLSALIQSYIADTELTSSELERQRELAMKYYLSRPLGNERSGRSSVVMSEVRDTVDWILPSLTEIFCGERSAVQFVPRHDDPENAAKIETAYCNWVINTKNNGFLIVNNWLQDGLLFKNGYVKAFWKECQDVSQERYFGQNPLELQALMSDQSFEVQSIEPIATEYGETYNVFGRRKKNYGKIVIQNIPPEHVRVHRDWRDLDLHDCPFVAHYEELTQGQLIDMGFSPEEIEGLPFSNGDQDIDTLDIYRKRDIDGDASWTGGNIDNGNKVVAVYECYVITDTDGDGVPERHKVIYEATSRRILRDEITDHVPIIAWTPSPLAHRHYGTSVFDRVMELQNIKTAIMRQMLDNLYLSNNPRTIVDPKKVELQDVLSPTIGGIIRLHGGATPQDVGTMAVPFVAQHSFPMLQYLDEVREQRTGVSKQSQGLDPAALKDQSIYGMSTLMEAAQQKIRYIARVFGETGFRKLVNIVRMLAAKHAQDEEVFGVAGEFARIDPRQWVKERDVYVTVGVGNTAPDMKMRALQAIQALQEKVIAAQGGNTAGTQAVMVDAVNAYNSIADTLEAYGIYNVSRYFKDPRPSMEMLNQMADQPPPPDPAVVVAEKELAIKEATELVKAQSTMAKHQDDMERQRMELELSMRQAEIERYKAETGRIEAMNNAAKTRLEAVKNNVTLDVFDPASTQKAMSVIETMQGNMQAAIESMQGAVTGIMQAVSAPKPKRRKAKKVADEWIIEDE
jgi:hypothetical protein